MHGLTSRRSWSPNFQVLKLEFTGGRTAPFFAALRTDLLRLEDLRITCAHQVAISERFALPSVLLDYLDRHPFSLKRLEIQGAFGTTFQHVDIVNIGPLPELLKRIPSIETLRVVYLQVSRDDFVRELIWRIGNTEQLQPQTRHNGRLLPNLRNLFLQDVRIHDRAQKLKHKIFLGFFILKVGWS